MPLEFEDTVIGLGHGQPTFFLERNGDYSYGQDASVFGHLGDDR